MTDRQLRATESLSEGLYYRCVVASPRSAAGVPTFREALGDKGLVVETEPAAAAPGLWWFLVRAKSAHSVREASVHIAFEYMAATGRSVDGEWKGITWWTSPGPGGLVDQALAPFQALADATAEATVQAARAARSAVTDIGQDVGAATRNIARSATEGGRMFGDLQSTIRWVAAAVGVVAIVGGVIYLSRGAQ